MSKPVGYSITSELVSAMSSLNMYPDGEYSEKEKYLSEVDSNAKHSMEHLDSIWNISKELRSELDDLKRVVMKDVEYSHEWEAMDKMFRNIDKRL